jgi:methionyl-tRNA synthetase
MALLMAQGEGEYILPEWILTNEFYELESEKFSTSKGHVLSVQDLLREVPRDVGRAYLALTAPEYQRTTFSRSGLDKMAEGRLTGPWNRLAGTLGKAVANARGDAPLPVSAAGRGRAEAMRARFDTCYEMPSYSLNRSADAILVQIGRLAGHAARLDGRSPDEEPEAWGDLFLEVKALLALAAPILIDLSAAARRAGGYDGVLTAGAFDVTEVRPFTPPLLPADTAEAPEAAPAGAAGRGAAAGGG